MKRIGIVFSLFLLVSSAFAQKADDIIGIYYSVDPYSKEGSQCEVFKNPDGTYSGKTVWVENPQNIGNIGLIFMSGLTYNAEKQEYQNGKISYPGKSRKFKTFVRMADHNNTMKMRGYLGISLLGKTVDWTREDKVRIQKYE